MAITEFQEKVYTHLLSIPVGSVTTYATIARSLSSSPRAVGGALRVNPYAPTVPCHRVIASTGYVGGFKGDWEKAPSGVNQMMKLELLRKEGVRFDGEGKLVMVEGGKGRKKKGGVWFEGPFDLEAGERRLREVMAEEGRTVK